jgi:hypothetical protein
MRFYGVAWRIFVDAQRKRGLLKAGYVDADRLHLRGELRLDKPGSAGVPAGELGENCGKAPARRRRSQAEHAYLSAIHLRGHRVALSVRPRRMGGLISVEFRRRPRFRSPVAGRVT